VIHTPRIRCNYCSRRIPATSVVCPHCQRNPRAFYWKREHVIALLVVVVALLGLGLFFLTIGANVLGSVLNGFQPVATTVAIAPSPAATRGPITVILVATRSPATAIRVTPMRTRARPTATARRTNSPTATSTPTRANAGTTARAAQITETPSPIPTSVPIIPPKLLSPSDSERIIGANKRVLLTFQPAQPISGQQWYRVQVDYLDRAGQASSWCAFTRDTVQEFPREFFDDSSPNVRSFLWRVNVVRSNEFAPITCDAPYDTLSPPSQVWTFYWF
jgi:hypothetical protein